MVIRVLSGQLRADGAGELGPVARAVLPALRDRPGLVSAHLGRQAGREVDRFVFVTVWRTMADLYEWTGPDLNRPVLLAGHEELLAGHTVEHYETLDDDLPE